MSVLGAEAGTGSGPAIVTITVVPRRKRGKSYSDFPCLENCYKIATEWLVTGIQKSWENFHLWDSKIFMRQS